MGLKRLVKTAGAVAPMVLGITSPAYGCLVLPDNQGTQNAAEGPAYDCGNVGCGPNAPLDGLGTADQNSDAVESGDMGMYVVPVGSSPSEDSE
ncbi:MAG: hypothetical protein M3370_11605 [Actinomycetota bacterium]|nr:hypothetical protein [Actinomycetota bacterium]